MLEGYDSGDGPPDPVSISALEMSREVISAVLLEDEESLESIIVDSDDETRRACICVLVGMVVAGILDAAHASDLDPIELWRRSIAKTISEMGF